MFSTAAYRNRTTSVLTLVRRMPNWNNGWKTKKNFKRGMRERIPDTRKSLARYSEFSQQASDTTLKIAVYQVYRFSRVDNLKAVFIDHRVEYREHPYLIGGKAVE